MQLFPTRRSVKNPVRLRRMKISTCLLVVVLLICVYAGIFHSHRYFGFDFNLWLCGVGVLSVGLIEIIWFDDYSKWHRLRSMLIFLLFCIPLLFFTFKLHQLYVAHQLSNYGKRTTGIVTGFFIRKGKNSRTPYAIFVYKLNEKEWTQSMANDEHPLLMGDTLQILCSEKDPEVFERVGYGKP